jgi:hypothetical protein
MVKKIYIFTFVNILITISCHSQVNWFPFYQPPAVDSIRIAGETVKEGLSGVKSRITDLENKVETDPVYSADSTDLKNDISAIEDTVQSHNSRILSLYDSIAKHTDTLQLHNVRLKVVESIDLDPLYDSIAKHTDTLQLHNVRLKVVESIDLDPLYDSIAKHTDTLQLHNVRLKVVEAIDLDPLYDSIAKHTDTLQLHNVRLKVVEAIDLNPLYDSIARHTDTLQLHNTRLKVLESAEPIDLDPLYDSIAKHTDTLQLHNTRLIALESAPSGGGSIDTIKSTTPASLTTGSYDKVVVYNSSTGRMYTADTTSSATFAGVVTFEGKAIFEDTAVVVGPTYMYGDIYADGLKKSDTTWIMVTPDGKLIPGDSITFASQGLTDELVPIEKYLSNVVDGELLWTWYDHTGRPWTIRGTGGTSPDKAIVALTWQAEHLLRYNLALEKKVNWLFGAVLLLTGFIIVSLFFIILKKQER